MKKMSDSLSKSPGHPFVNFERVPADSARSESHPSWKLFRLHKVVDVRSLEAGFRFDFRKAEDSAIA
jgi:hypothetical protein